MFLRRWGTPLAISAPPALPPACGGSHRPSPGRARGQSALGAARARPAAARGRLPPPRLLSFLSPTRDARSHQRMVCSWAVVDGGSGRDGGRSGLTTISRAPCRPAPLRFLPVASQHTQSPARSALLVSRAEALSLSLALASSASRQTSAGPLTATTTFADTAPSPRSRSCATTRRTSPRGKTARRALARPWLSRSENTHPLDPPLSASPSLPSPRRARAQLRVRADVDARGGAGPHQIRRGGFFFCFGCSLGMRCFFFFRSLVLCFGPLSLPLAARSAPCLQPQRWALRRWPCCACRQPVSATRVGNFDRAIGCPSHF